MNSFQTQAICDLREAGFDARPTGNWVYVLGGYRPETIYSVAGVEDYIANNEPPAFETELTDAGEQTVIPGCERNASPKAKQLDLFG